MEVSSIGNNPTVPSHASLEAPLNSSSWGFFLMFYVSLYASCFARIAILSACNPIRPGAHSMILFCPNLKIALPNIFLPIISLRTSRYERDQTPFGLTGIGYSSITVPAYIHPLLDQEWVPSFWVCTILASSWCPDILSSMWVDSHPRCLSFPMVGPILHQTVKT